MSNQDTLASQFFQLTPEASEPAQHPIDLLPEDAFRWYLTGLTDGEGCFHLTNAKSTKQWMAHFVLAMRADESESILAMRRRMGCGNTSQEDHRKKQHPMFRWCVSDSPSLQKIIVPHFERYPLQFKKRRDFEIWREAVAMLYSLAMRWKGHSRRRRMITNADRLKLASLRESLISVRKFNSEKSVLPFVFIDERPCLPFTD